MGLHTIERPNKAFSKTNKEKPASESATVTGSKPAQYILNEINAYIAIRDMRIATAEQDATPENLRQATLANDFVELCLKRPQEVYAAQYLPEASASFERERCATIKALIGALKANGSANS